MKDFAEGSGGVFFYVNQPQNLLEVLKIRRFEKIVPLMIENRSL